MVSSITCSPLELLSVPSDVVEYSSSYLATSLPFQFRRDQASDHEHGTSNSLCSLVGTIAPSRPRCLNENQVCGKGDSALATTFAAPDPYTIVETGTSASRSIQPATLPFDGLAASRLIK